MAISPSHARRPRKQKSRYRHEEGKVCIEIEVKQLKQLFDHRDPSPFIDKDLDDDAVDYIVSSAEEFSLKTPLKIRIQTWESLIPPGGNSLATEVSDAIHNYFEYSAALLHKKVKKTFRNARFSLLIGIFSLALCLSLSQWLQSWVFAGTTLKQVLHEGAVITGWVAMWRPINLFLYDWWPLYEKSRFHEKLQKTPIEIIQLKHEEKV